MTEHFSDVPLNVQILLACEEIGYSAAELARTEAVIEERILML